MDDLLIKLLQLEISYDDSIWWNAYKSWINSDTQSKIDFSSSRIKIILENYKEYHKNRENWASNLFSSGTTGVRKSYFFGPYFREIDNLYKKISYEGLKFDFKIGLKFYFNKNKHFNEDIILFDPRKNKSNEKLCLIYCDPDHEFDTKKFVKICTNNYKEKILLSIIPSMLNFLFKKNFDLSKLTPDLFSFCSTGEKPDEKEMTLIKNAEFEYRDYMRCWDGGASFFTCKYGNKHWIEMLSEIWTDSENRLTSNDLFNICQPHLSYKNGDRVSLNYEQECQCGLVKSNIEFHDKKIASKIINQKMYTFDNLELVLVDAWKKSGLNPSNLTSSQYGFRDNEKIIIIYYDYLNCQILTHHKDMIIKTFREHFKDWNISLDRGQIYNDYKKIKIFDL